MVVSQDESDVEGILSLIGADTMRIVEAEDSEDNRIEDLHEILDFANCDIFIAPEDAPLEDVINDLRDELPWIQ